MVKLSMLGGKCGCITCRDGVLDDDRKLTRTFWKSRTNTRGHGYGRTKPTGKKVRRKASAL